VDDLTSYALTLLSALSTYSGHARDRNQTAVPAPIGDILTAMGNTRCDSQGPEAAPYLYPAFHRIRANPKLGFSWTAEIPEITNSISIDIHTDHTSINRTTVAAEANYVENARRTLVNKPGSPMSFPTDDRGRSGAALTGSRECRMTTIFSS
jgi:hypothetical protein